MTDHYDWQSHQQVLENIALLLCIDVENCKTKNGRKRIKRKIKIHEKEGEKMSNNLTTIKRNLYILFWKYPELKNKNYNFVYMSYCDMFHEEQLFELIEKDWNLDILPRLFEKMPAMESISRCKRKLALKDEIFRPDKKVVIESRLKQSSEILESVRD